MPIVKLATYSPGGSLPGGTGPPRPAPPPLFSGVVRGLILPGGSLPGGTGPPIPQGAATTALTVAARKSLGLFRQGEDAIERSQPQARRSARAAAQARALAPTISLSGDPTAPRPFTAAMAPASEERRERRRGAAQYSDTPTLSALRASFDNPARFDVERQRRSAWQAQQSHGTSSQQYLDATRAYAVVRSAYNSAPGSQGRREMPVSGLFISGIGRGVIEGASVPSSAAINNLRAAVRRADRQYSPGTVLHNEAVGAYVTGVTVYQSSGAR